jgi:hypothetical protein
MKNALGAVLLYESMGYLSLIEKYETPGHVRKFELFKDMVGPKLFDDIRGDRVGSPDLFVFAPDRSDWFFCEVKGAADVLRDCQLRRFRRLFDITGKRVYVLSLKKRKR